MPEFYNILRLSKEDVEQALEEYGNNKLAKEVPKLTAAEMEYLATKLAEAYLETDYWPTLNSFAEDLIEEKKSKRMRR